MRKFLLIAGLILVIVLARMSVFTVDATEFAYVTQLGQHVATHDGGDSVSGAGLHWRWPWPIQSVQRLDRRLQVFDLPSIELYTSDADRKRIGKTLAAEVYATWRIASPDEVDHFVRRIGTPEQARVILGQRINSQLRAATSLLGLEDLISKKPGHAAATMDDLRNGLLKKLKPQVRKDYGIDLVDLRLRRFNHPSAVREDIFVHIRSERTKMVEEIRSKGSARAKNIKSEAEAKESGILAQAKFEEETIKGQAITEAAQIRNQAHSQDPDFYVFLKKMENLHSILADSKTVLLLSTHRSIFDSLFNPPQPGGQPAVGPGNGEKGPMPPGSKVAPQGPPRTGGQ
jgi:membrane protease subunit HflC